MATVAGVDLRLDEPHFSAGAAFRLNPVDFDSVTVEPESGQVVEVHPRKGVALAFLGAPDRVGYIQAHEAAQRALDIVAYADPRLATALVRPHDELIQWWRDEDGVTIRANITKVVGVSLSVTLTVLQADRTARPQPTEPTPSWTPALRYLRYAQIAEDVFDAYRNTFLALEAVLSERVTNGPRGEERWLKHALTAVGVDVDLSSYISTPGVNPVASFVEEQYRALRCATFHAKNNRKVLLPGSVTDRESVTAALEHLCRLVVDLTQSVVGARRQDGGMTYVGFEQLYIGPKVGKLALRVAHREGVADSVALNSRYLGKDVEDPREHAFVGETLAASIAGRVFDTITASAPGGEGLAARPLDESFDILPIDVTGADQFEVWLFFVLNNVRAPRNRFVR